MWLVLLSLLACDPESKAPPVDLPRGTLEMEFPAAGDWLSAGDAEARGTGTNLAEVAVDGAGATVDGTDWTAPLTLPRGVSVVEATATDLNGDALFVRHGVIAGEFASPEGLVEGAVVARLNQGGIDRVEAMAEALLDPATLNGKLGALNPVYTDSYGVWGWDAVTISADILSVDFGEPALELTPTESKVELSVVLPDVEVAVLAYGDVVGWDFDTEVSIWASEAVLAADVDIDALGGALDVELGDVSVELRDFGYDTSLLPGDVEEYVLVDTLRSTLEEMLVEQIETMVPPLLDETLAGLAPSVEMEMLGVPVTLTYAFADVDPDPDGLQMTLDLEVDMPSGTSRAYAGYLTAPGGSPAVDPHADLAAAVSDDLLNRVLFEAWRAGLLDLRLSTDDGTLDGFLLTPFHATQGTITVSPALPPVVVERDGGLEAQVAELIVTIDTPGGELGEHLEVAVAAFVGLEVRIDDGELVLDLGEPDLVLAVRDSDWGATDESTTTLLEENLPLDTLLALLGELSFELPSLYGISFDRGEAERDASGVHTDVRVWVD